jgi:N-acetylmuramoyl-L-alanine amidase
MQRVRISSVLLIFFLFFTTYPTAQALGAEETVTTPSSERSGAQAIRIYGKDRIATSIAASRQGWPTSEVVILNEYTNYADAISATPLAVQLDAPLLLTAGDKLDSRVIDEFKRLQAKKIILLGGNGRIQTSIENELTGLGYSWERIGGTDRYETSTLIAKKITSKSIILVNGDDFPDALSAASFAGIEQIPILLMSNPSFPQSVSDYYQIKKPEQVIVVGGEGVTPSKLLQEKGISVNVRLGGKDRYETDAQLYAYAQKAYTSDQLYLASGEQYPDAMVGTVLAAKNKAALLITTRGDLPNSIAPLFNPQRILQSTVIILGGTAVVSGKIQAEIEGKDFNQFLLTGKTVVVDPGHGSPDPGAKGPSGTLEKDNTLAIAKFLASELKTSGAKVVLTRLDDSSPAYTPSTEYTQKADLQKRVDIANENNADLFISIHNDSWQTAHGTTTFYSSENPSSDSSYKLGQAIQAQLTHEIGTQNLGVKDSRFYVLRNNTMPAVLVEVAFISHPIEEKLLADESYRLKASKGISKGIFQFIRSQEGI